MVPVLDNRHTKWIVGAVLMAMPYCVVWIGEERATALTREDGIIENAGALGFLAAAGCCGAAWVVSRQRGRETNKPLCLLFAALFLVGFLEEISWGQRIFSIRTPAWVAAHNTQAELTIHNLDCFAGTDVRPGGGLFRAISPTRLCNVFWLVFFVGVPIASNRSGFAQFLQRWRVPIVPLGVGFLFLINHAMGTAACVIARSSGPLGHAATEVKETNTELLFALSSLIILSAELRLRDGSRHQILANAAGCSDRVGRPEPAINTFAVQHRVA